MLDLETPEAFAELYDPPLGDARWRVYYGGRGSAKSWQKARALLVHGMAQPLRVLCCRQYQTSIRESVHKLLSLQIAALGLGGFYDVQDRTIVARDGSTEFIFRGLAHNADEIKSLEAVDVCWVEEGESVSADSWSVLIPTIRKAGSEIWVSFNPGEPTDPTFVMLVTEAHKLPRAIVRKVSYLDNPFASAITIEEAETLRRNDPDAYAHVYGGEPWHRSELQVFLGKYRVEEFEPERWWSGPYFGCDFGFSRDPSVLVKLYVGDGRLYVRHEARGVQLDMDQLAHRFGRVPGSRRYRIYGDGARPETINELRRRKFNVVAAPKWSGSVLDGIEYLRGTFEAIVIHPTCTGLVEEMRLYRYAADKQTGDPLPKLAKGHDHGPDAIRYALSPLIKKARPQLVWFPGMDETTATDLEG